MKQAKFEERIENAFDSFFDDGSSANDKMNFVGDSTLLKVEKTFGFNEKADEYFAAFKKIFLFLPGVLILHLASFATVHFYKDFGINSWMLFWFASGIFMTWAGIGDLKNKKHALIPASIIFVATVLAITGSFLLPQNFEYSFYLFPLLFIAPVLVKSWIDESSRGKFGD